MKYFIVLILLLGTLCYGLVTDAEFSTFLNASLLFLIFLTLFVWEYSVLNKNFESDFKIKSYGKKINGFSMTIASFWTALLILNKYYDSFIFLVLFLWAHSIIEFTFHFIYKAKKPFTLFIKENEIILNKSWAQKRNLIELTQIRYDRFSKKLKLKFKSKSEISINTTDYKTEDIQKLMGILIEKSEHNVCIPQNYEPNKKTAANNV
ncbi:hypothetical protein N1F78_01145 [Seonamhaeicola sp. MEBiC1930]|uniref:hypothetical protein n=1 Tax=Seonamhaeicola sp. MEBiC01930 TaxID=2976768 RepID=UPI003244FEEF